jgi:hypothetical protein
MTPTWIAALESKAQERALSIFGYARMSEEYTRVCRQAVPSAESYICLEANEFSKNSRVADTL